MWAYMCIYGATFYACLSISNNTKYVDFSEVLVYVRLLKHHTLSFNKLPYKFNRAYWYKFYTTVNEYYVAMWVGDVRTV